MADKDVPGVVAAAAAARSLAGATSSARRCRRPARPAARGPRRRLACGRARADVRVAPDPDAALALALATGAGPVVVAGSLYLVGAARARLVDDPALRDPEGHDRRSRAPRGDRPGGRVTDRRLPGEQGVVQARPGQGGGAATPSFGLPEGAGPGIPGTARSPSRIGPRTFAWGARTYVMGILNVTPGLLLRRRAARRRRIPVAAAVDLARRMVDEGADLLDVGGASSRPGHAASPPDEEAARVVPVIRAVAAALPEHPAVGRHDEPCRRRGGARRRRAPAQRRVGRRRRPGHGSASPRRAASRSS